MYDNILPLVVGLVKKIIERAENGELKELDVMASNVKEDLTSTSIEIVKELIQAANNRLREDKEARKELGLVIKEKDRPRELYTDLGMISFTRDYYYDKQNKTHVAVLDEMLGIEKRERVGGAVKAELISLAADFSYAKSTDILTSGAVSRQTIHDQLLKMSVPETKPPERKETVKELHVYADEDHAHLQKPSKEKGKKSKIIPLVTLTEGTRQESRNRNRTINPVHFVDEEFDTKRLWKAVEGYIDKAYDVSALDAIYVHGDGGQWIRNGLEIFPQTKHIMDGYHFERDLRTIAKIFPRRNVTIAIRNTLVNDDRKKADAFIQELLSEQLTEKDIDKVGQFAGYLFCSWEQIRRRVKGGIPGSCTEAQVSHVLSERFSRDPLGWSETVLGKLTGVRVYIRNGGEITKNDLKAETKEQERYSEYAERYIQEGIKGAIDFSMFENELPIFDTDSGTQHAIRNLLQ